MSIRLLLDENLSERLLPLLSDRFPDSSHVRLIGLGGADDLVIWEWGHREAFFARRESTRKRSSKPSDAIHRRT